MYTHSMGVWLAVKYGMAEAMLLGYFYYWICRNETKQEQDKFHDGRYWVYDSVRGLQKKFPYISIGKIAKITNMFVDEGILLKGNFNKLQWDKTVWYALTDKGRKMMDDLAQCSSWEESCERMSGTCSRYEQGVHSMNEGVHSMNDNTYSIHLFNLPNMDDDDNIKQTSKKKKVNQKFEPSFENPIHSKAVDDWEKYMGIPLTQGLAEQIISLVDEVGGDIFLEALKVASANNVRRLKYVETVAVNMMRGDDYGSNQRSNQSGEKPAGKKPGRKKAIKGDSVPKLGDYI